MLMWVKRQKVTCAQRKKVWTGNEGSERIVDFAGIHNFALVYHAIVSSAYILL